MFCITFGESEDKTPNYAIAVSGHRGALRCIVFAFPTERNQQHCVIQPLTLLRGSIAFTGGNAMPYC